MEIGIAKKSEAEELAELRIRFFDEMGNPKYIGTPRERERLRLANRDFYARKLEGPDFVVACAREDGRIVSLAQMSIFEKAPNVGCLSGVNAYITNVLTLPAHRGKGLARRVLKELVGRGRGAGVEEFFLVAEPMGRPVYHKLGFYQDASPIMWLNDFTTIDGEADA